MVSKRWIWAIVIVVLLAAAAVAAVVVYKKKKEGILINQAYTGPGLSVGDGPLPHLDYEHTPVYSQ